MTAVRAAEMAHRLIDEIAVRPLVEAWFDACGLEIDDTVDQVVKAICAADTPLEIKVKFIHECLEYGGFIDRAKMLEAAFTEAPFKIWTVLRDTFFLSTNGQVLKDLLAIRGRGMGAAETFLRLACWGSKAPNTDVHIPYLGRVEVKATDGESSFTVVAQNTNASARRRNAGIYVANMDLGITSLAEKSFLKLLPVHQRIIAGMITEGEVKTHDSGIFLEIATFGFREYQESHGFDMVLAFCTSTGKVLAIHSAEQFTSFVRDDILRLVPSKLDFWTERGRGIGIKFA